ncbi:hypothetical protein Hanom_Chr07g00671781 [Helianthus anomalus]
MSLRIRVRLSLRPGSPLADHVVDEEIPPLSPLSHLHPLQYPHHVIADLPPDAQAVARDFDRRLRRADARQTWII